MKIITAPKPKQQHPFRLAANNCARNKIKIDVLSGVFWPPQRRLDLSCDGLAMCDDDDEAEEDDLMKFYWAVKLARVL